MRPSAITALFLTLIAPVLAQYNFSSSPFRLMIESQNSTLNGTVLGACHENAGIEALCPVGSTLDDSATSVTTFYQNVSYFRDSSNSTVNTPGLLCWDLYLGSLGAISSPMYLNTMPNSNVATPIISTGRTILQRVVFDECGWLGIQSYLDDSSAPPARRLKTYMNWMVCTTYFSYTMETLAWVLGSEPIMPQNPTCQRVLVKRVFIEP
ncbi:hypothetical protein GQ43DRAFT_498286 [Delitschia confertaspora ATCC 74209]|uniref:DUF7907 domain-containing protein n=1 Tax=Delitschia confertaspora ATCC 74209 TaxID=1513339 RepID=A0A9P4MUH8_9PLEO|nr:hypothetical protein GQ43DRAFT_498286 [Delitschia confertaspora ATCC 74209]